MAHTQLDLASDSQICNSSGQGIIILSTRDHQLHRVNFVPYTIFKQTTNRQVFVYKTTSVTMKLEAFSNERKKTYCRNKESTGMPPHDK